MRVTVHRVEAAIWYGERLLTTWLEHRFRPTPLVTDREDGCDRMWSKSKALEVNAPPLCRLEPVELVSHHETHGKTPARKAESVRLVTPFDPIGWDASTVIHAAERGLRGFALAGPVAVVERITKLCENRNLPPTTPTAPEAKRWGIAFQSRTYYGRTFLSRSAINACRVASTRDLADVESWDDPGDAMQWMRTAGLDPSRPISLGLDYLYPSVAKIPAELPGCGVEFELTRAVRLPEELPASNPEPAETPVAEEVRPTRRKRELVGQLAFNF